MKHTTTTTTSITTIIIITLQSWDDVIFCYYLTMMTTILIVYSFCIFCRIEMTHIQFDLPIYPSKYFYWCVNLTAFERERNSIFNTRISVFSSSNLHLSYVAHMCKSFNFPANCFQNVVVVVVALLVRLLLILISISTSI